MRDLAIPSPTQILTTDSFQVIHRLAKAGKLSHICGHYVVRHAVSERGQAKNEKQSRNVYENKGNVYILPRESSDIFVESTRIVGHFGTKRQEPSVIVSPIDTNRRTFWCQMT
jgi:hypothetical protein